MESQVRICPMCAEEVPAEAQTCPFCQTRLGALTQGYCTTCHQVTHADEQGRCQRCGQPLVDVQAQSEPVVELPTAAPPPPEVQPAPKAAETADHRQTYSRPGSYIDKKLRVGESIQYRTRLHRVQLLDAVWPLVFSIACFLLGRWMATSPVLESLPEPFNMIFTAAYSGQLYMWFFYVLGGWFGLMALSAVLVYLGSEVAITPQRLLGRITALIPRKVDIPYNQIVKISNRVGGRYDQAHVDVVRLPYVLERIPHVPKPNDFRWRVESYLPQVRPPVRKPKLWAIGLLLLLLVAGVVGISLWQVGYLDTIFPPSTATPEPLLAASYETFPELAEGTRVYIEGSLNLPGKIRCEEQCGLYLEDFYDPAQRVVIFIDLNYLEGTALPNQMEKLPSSYTVLDFEARMDNGEWAHAFAKVRLTGKVCRTTTDVPCLLVTKIEPAQNAPATATPAPQVPTPFPADYETVQALKADCENLNAQHQLGRISGTLHVPADVYCAKGAILGMYCSIYLEDSRGESIYFSITEGLDFDPLPANYTREDLFVRDTDRELIPDGSPVTILFGTYIGLDDSKCYFTPREIFYEP